MEHQEENTEELQKMCRKGALVEIQRYVGEITVANERIAEIKDALKEDYGTHEAGRIVELARMIEKNTYQTAIDKHNELEELKEEILNTGE